MKVIKIKSITLVNFKGIRSLDLNFHNDGDTIVAGDNDTGKTTVFDAFLWCLFGKDSTGRSDSNFNIKTLDKNRKPILKAEHSVSVTLTVDGNEINLQRNYCEKWVKPKGTAIEKLQNHQTEFYVNGVKCGTKKEYEAEVNDLIPEDVFRMITSPSYFPLLAPDVQKEFLQQMAGEITDEEVAQLKPAYVELLAQLNGRPMEKYAKEVSMKKRAINDTLKVIPSQIETAAKLKPEAEEWAKLESEKDTLKQQIHVLDEQIADKNAINTQESERKAGIQSKISNKRMELMSRENTLKTEAMAATNEAQKEIQNLRYQCQSKERELGYVNAEIKQHEERRGKLIDELAALRAEFKQINARVLTIDPNVFVCPTCKRPLEADDIEAKQRELEENFNSEKAALIKRNKETGMAKKATLDIVDKELQAKQNAAQSLETDIADLKIRIEAKEKSNPQAPDTAAILANDSTCIQIKNDIAELENQLTVNAKPADTTELMQKKAALNQEVEALVNRLAKKSQIERADKEIAELEDKRTKNQQELADLEKWEDTALSFQKDKDAKLLDRINGMFSVVSFSFVNAQLNGGEKLTCVCTVNGVPYPDVNYTGKLNAGLDIINAICRCKGVCAPIFIDNSESFNTIIPTVSQKILLKVSHDKSLTVY